MPTSVDSPALTAAVPPTPIAALLGALRRPAAPIVLMLVGAALAVLGSQLPQAGAPHWVADGLAREDHLALATTGLDRLDAALATWLWWIAAVAIIGLRIPHAQTAEPRFRWQAACWVASATCWAGWTLWSATAGSATWVDVGIDSADVAAQAWTADAGQIVPAVGRFAGTCKRPAGAMDIDCQLESPVGAVQVHLGPGRPDRRDGYQYTWLGRGPAAASPLFQFVGSAGTRGPDGARTAVALQTGKPVLAQTLGSRWIPTAGAMAGPAVLVTGADGPGVWWVSPALAGSSAAAAVARAAERARIQVAPTSPAEHLWAAALLAAAAAVLMGADRARKAES